MTSPRTPNDATANLIFWTLRPQAVKGLNEGWNMLLQMTSKNLAMLKDPGFLVIGKKYRLGRASICSFVVNDLSVTRVHAELIANAESVLVRDLSSLNGTFLNGVRFTEAEVRPNQVVVFGTASFQLTGHDLSDIAEPSTIAPPINPLSDAQQRVLEHLLKGCSEKETAGKLCLSPYTVHNHVKAIYVKYSVNSRAELLARFVEDSRFRRATHN